MNKRTGFVFIRGQNANTFVVSKIITEKNKKARKE